MTRPSAFDIGARSVATARAVLKSPDNVTCLPWVAITMQELAVQEARKAIGRDKAATMLGALREYQPY